MKRMISEILFAVLSQRNFLAHWLFSFFHKELNNKLIVGALWQMWGGRACLVFPLFVSILKFMFGCAYDLHCCVFPNSHFGILWNTPDKHKHTPEWTKQASYQGLVGVACLWLACRTHRTRGSLSTERALKIYLTFCLSVFLSICLFVFVSLCLCLFFVFLYTGILKFTWQAIFHLSGSVTLNIILRTPIFLVAIYK